MDVNRNEGGNLYNIPSVGERKCSNPAWYSNCLQCQHVESRSQHQSKTVDFFVVLFLFLFVCFFICFSLGLVLWGFFGVCFVVGLFGFF